MTDAASIVYRILLCDKPTLNMSQFLLLLKPFKYIITPTAFVMISYDKVNASIEGG